ncbi:hypothetical protein LNQ49_16760 [Flavobacterium sp. F-65]|uniref:PH domain-containing protein n=1 Tax=Flavobacterium pisciphilum TaxID=2893755 RepID=A0ABS8MZE8_9FLAO|nr:hypothetical protein [Flavobacterium sp. F-65]MCC9073230.1 hypothetical protein [Flavobacterium sp. F-65]
MMFKRNKKYLLYRVLVSHLFILLIAIGGNLTCNNVLPIWSIFVVVPNLILTFFKNLRGIEIKDDCIILIFNKYFFKEHIEVYEYKDLKFTYGNEFEGANSISLKFRIYKKDCNKSIISIGGIIDGWYKEQMDEIIEELEKKRIEVIL